jgi:hypothetical protein
LSEVLQDGEARWRSAKILDGGYLFDLRGGRSLAAKAHHLAYLISRP